MVLSYQQSELLYQPFKPDGYYLAFTEENPAFFDAINFVKWPTKHIKGQNYSTEADLTGMGPTFRPVFTTDGGAPPLLVGGLPVIPYANNLAPRRASWQLTGLDTAWLYLPEEQKVEGGIYTKANLSTKLEALGRTVIQDIITRSLTVTANHIASFQAILNGYTDSLGLVEGYSPTILAEQMVIVGGPLMQRDLIGGTYTISSITPLIRAKGMVRRGADFLIVPERFYYAYANNYQKGGQQIPTITASTIAGFPANTGQTGLQPTFPLLEGIPMIVVKDSIYTLAGHDVVSAIGDYDLYLIRAARGLADGAGIGFMGPETAEMGLSAFTGSDGLIQPGLTTIPLGAGMSFYKGGMLQSTAGVINAMPRKISAEWQLFAGKKDDIVIIQGVSD